MERLCDKSCMAQLHLTLVGKQISGKPTFLQFKFKEFDPKNVTLNYVDKKLRLRDATKDNSVGLSLLGHSLGSNSGNLTQKEQF